MKPMATVYTKTDNYGLNLYGDNDPADLRDGYNGSMRTVDTALKQHLTRITDCEKSVSNANGKADANSGVLAALGAAGKSAAAAAKTKWDQAALDAAYAKDKVNTPNLKDYVVVLGDSWVDAWYGGVKHFNESPAIPIKNKLAPKRFYYKGSSGGGFSRRGDDGTFLDIWRTTPERSKVTAVIIIGGQNDAKAQMNASDVKKDARDLMEAIHADAPNAEIHVCPMVLPVGETLTKSSESGLQIPLRMQVYRELTSGLKAMGYAYVRVHEGGYRIGVVAAQSTDGGDAGDNTHLTKQGYWNIGCWIAHCVAADVDLWPTETAKIVSTSLTGDWEYAVIREERGLLYINFSIKYSSTSKPADNALMLRLPKWASVLKPCSFPSYTGAGHYVVYQGSELRMKGISPTMPSALTLAGSYIIPMGV